MIPERFPLGRRLLLGVLSLAAVTCMGAGDSQQAAQALNTCAPLSLDPARLLRQMSLDLRGTPPTFDEVQAAVRAGAVTPDMVDGMLQSPQFLDQAKRWHADILWPNLNGFIVHSGGLRLTRGGTNPEAVVDLLDARTDEPTCPTSGTGQITATACCTASSPNSPACCMARNTVYNPADPACVAKAESPLVGAAFTVGTAVGDIAIRGGTGGTGCDDGLEYPPSSVASTDHRWLHDAAGRPYYISARSGHVRYYYDADSVPLPYDDWTHCPDYCRANAPTGPGGVYAAADFVAKQHMVAGRMVQGDAPDATCPDGFTEVVNTCDNGPQPATNFERNLKIRREGYRLMTPYWAGNHLVKVCAFEAQERTNSAFNGAPCQPGLRQEYSCGCGPDGRYCEPSQGYNNTVPTRAEYGVRQGLNDEPLEIVASVIGRDEDYYNSYTTRRSFVTGPLAYMYRNQVDRMQGLPMTAPVPATMLPDVPYADTTWHEYDRGPEHSGVLTTPAYLGRFPTWRSRINRFRTALLCQPFTPPAGGLPAPDDPCNREPNLARRCGCQHCHTAIEPLGAYWGRWAERASMYLDPQTYPAFDPDCAACATSGQFCSARCRNNYVTNTLDADGARYAGTLFGYLYRSPEETPRLDQGPATLVANALSTGQMQSCTVSTLWSRLVGRSMNDQEIQDVLPGLLQGFESSHHNYRALVRAIVSAPAYRRID